MPAHTGPVLLLDIGSGTQDVLLYVPGRELENCPKFVLPAPARLKGQKILDLNGAPLWLHGGIMGGGMGRALGKHLKDGGKAAAHPHAALTLSDDLDRVRDMGVDIVEECPEGYTPVFLADYDPAWWSRLLAAAEVESPVLVTACAQDHGHHPPGFSNRVGRFLIWERLLLESGGRPEALIFDKPPKELTRLEDLHQAIGQGPVADTGAAACLGALFMPEIQVLSAKRGVTVLNLGNSHTIAFLVFQGRILGVYEHHTGMRGAAGLLADLAGFRKGTLAQQEVFDSGGHGCLTLDLPAEAGDFAPTYVLGPQRGLLEKAPGPDISFPAPGGDMMLAGCFGLLHGLRMMGHPL